MPTDTAVCQQRENGRLTGAVVCVGGPAAAGRRAPGGPGGGRPPAAGAHEPAAGRESVAGRGRSAARRAFPPEWQLGGRWRHGQPHVPRQVSRISPCECRVTQTTLTCNAHTTRVTRAPWNRGDSSQRPASTGDGEACVGGRPGPSAAVGLVLGLKATSCGTGIWISGFMSLTFV